MSESLLKNELAVPAPAALVADLMLKKGLFLATAESCTGGLISAACTDLAGSSAWFERGFVTYSNEAKTASLGVDAALIAQHGAVSQPVAEAMARGAITHSLAQVAVAVTGLPRLSVPLRVTVTPAIGVSPAPRTPSSPASTPAF